MASEKVEHAPTRPHLVFRVASSSLAVAAATTFVALAALLSFVPEPQETGSAWVLRGTLAPGATAGAPLPAGAKRA